jgi:hypothetical protein
MATRTIDANEAEEEQDPRQLPYRDGTLRIAWHLWQPDAETAAWAQNLHDRAKNSSAAAA